MVVINRAEVLERLGEDEELYAEICALFVRDAATMLDRLQTELTARRLEVATRYAHSMKSMASNVGAVQVAEAARQLEAAGREGDADEMERRMPELLQSVERALAALTP